MELQEFKAELLKIDKQRVAEEIIGWLTRKVDTYIDNHQAQYNLSFLSDDQMPETLKVEALGNTLDAIEISTEEIANLEKEIEENEEVKKESELIDCLREFMDDIRSLMIENEDGMKSFFVALSKYYSTVAFYKNKPINKDLAGYINLEYIGFENIKMDVFKTPLVPVYNSKREIVDYKRDETKRELVTKMPPAFAIDFGIEFWENKEDFSLF
jgi:uncharacterized protein (DUF2164 family)